MPLPSVIHLRAWLVQTVVSVSRAWDRQKPQQRIRAQPSARILVQRIVLGRRVLVPGAEHFPFCKLRQLVLADQEDEADAEAVPDHAHPQRVNANIGKVEEDAGKIEPGGIRRWSLR